MTIRVVLADDHPIVLGGLVSLFEQETDMKVVARCSNGEAALRAVRENRPDILVLDLRMPRLGGMEVLRRAAREGLGARVVVLAADVAEEDLIEAVRLGVRGVVLKETALDRVVDCVRTVHGGGQWLDRELTGRAFKRLLTREADRQQSGRLLTPREAELVDFVNQGLRNKEIAARLGVAEGTVKGNPHRIFEKLGVSNRVELVNYTRHRGN